MIDGARTRENGWARDGIWLDPGRHEVEIHVAGKLPWRASPTLREGEVVDLRVELASPPAEPPATGNALRPVGTVIAATGVIVTAVGVTAGILAIDRRNDARQACGSDEPKQCRDPAAVGQWDSALTAANVSTITLIAGGALLGTGAVLWFMGNPKAKVTARADLTGGRVGFEGHW